MASTAVAATRKIFERCAKALTGDERAALRRYLAERKKEAVGRSLHKLRPHIWPLFDLDLATRRRLLAGYPEDHRRFLTYAAAAWAAKTVFLFELLDDLDPVLPAKWAGPAALRLLSSLEDDDGWLWPFDDEPPWPLETDPDDETSTY